VLLKKLNNNKILIESLHRGLDHAFHFSMKFLIFVYNRNPKLLATYSSNINQLIFLSTCGETRGKGPYEFDSPWSVATLLDRSSSSSNVLVTDTNNRRLQYFSIGNNHRFLLKHTLITKEKPYFVTTNNQHFAVSCEKSLIISFLAKERIQMANIDLNRASFIQSKIFE
jgi:hypothetical protein